MSVKGIIFSAPMVRGLLDGRKTQTRRLIKPRRAYSLFDGSWSDSYILDPGNDEWRMRDLPCAPGDRLYVREAWHVRGVYSDVVEVGYRASANRSHTEYVGQVPVELAVPGKGKWPEFPKYGPSIHMPRWASRITLTVTEVRVQRLQEINADDCRAEGLGDGDFDSMDPRGWYRDLWDSLHTKPGERWEDNPWIVAVSFSCEQRNIDEVLA